MDGTAAQVPQGLRRTALTPVAVLHFQNRTGNLIPSACLGLALAHTNGTVRHYIKPSMEILKQYFQHAMIYLQSALARLAWSGMAVACPV